MRWHSIVVAVLLVSAGMLYIGWLDPVADIMVGEEQMNTTWREQVRGEEPVNATLAGGCFWCIEAVYDGREGIASAVSGYAGGSKATATYEQVSTGTTDHREAVRVKFYPSIISYEGILELYWRSIDPTDPDGQFTDRGPQYTTAIYSHTPRQYRLARQSKENLSGSDRFEEPIVTEIENFTTFFRAEDYHQNYSRRRTARYKIYEEGSGRPDYVEDKWGE